MDILTLIPSFGNLLFTGGAFVVALSVIVAIHEYGHYIVGRWCGIHAEVFSIGFGPVLTSRVDRRGTRWQIAALPFGGYVRFLGDSDAASGKDGRAIEAMGAETRRRTMHGAPLWARTATVAAGPLANFLLAVVVFAALSLVRGTAIEPPTVGELKPLPRAVAALEPGDEIVAINGQATPDYASFYGVVGGLPPGGAVTYRLRQGGETREITGTHPFPPIIDEVQPGLPAGEVGLKPGDVIVSIDGQPISAFPQMQQVVNTGGGAPMVLGVWRDGREFAVTLAPRSVDLPQPDGGFETRWLIGMTGALAFSPQTRTPGVIEALAYGGNQIVYIIQASLSGLYHMVTGAISSCNLSGPLGIAESAGAAAAQGPSSFIWLIAMLSVAIGLLNLFPVPVLDGGHLVFYAYEAIAGAPPPERAMQAMMAFGFAMLVMLMGFAIFNDMVCR
ncbi:regulator of sigma E protease [Rhodovulum imhoffii]|uniref:Zinc metalloprotease n=1 Tax=Rhodovulum imhoffii TaxID=365340 RepID=A0A2T5BTK4_9RHOB|nr:RIP metalloprotease RseP [Rhodovulum imhoffii]MBK5934164.1 RIP metalloprotease RseP [Rhodovulum imhoffii]PTN02760.1 regulator of sigma E protease [Rhodovulum imhoffii]